MDKIVIVGSGASGVHFARTILEKGYQVVMLDVGRVRPPIVNPRDTFNELKQRLPDPVQYFLGREYEAVVYPGSEGEYYGFPPNKSYVFSKPQAFAAQATGFAPLASFAQGGLAETWTGGAYPMNDDDLTEFPFGYTELEPFYTEVARRIGISGVADDLARFYPVHGHLMPPLRLDRHSTLLLEMYARHRDDMNSRLGCYLGRSRAATLSADRNGRMGCGYLGRCLWGCPTGSLYTPAITLDECRRFPNFSYLSDVYVSHFRIAGGRLAAAVTESVDGRPNGEIAGDRFALAAGTLSSSLIYMRTVRQERGATLTLGGLMDNRQVLVPFLNLALIGARYEPDTYQYHQVAMGIDSGDPKEYVHALITTLKTALLHPIVQNVPVDLRTAVGIFRAIRAGLGILNVNLRDWRRQENCLTLGQDGSGRTTLVISYQPPPSERHTLSRTLTTVRKALWRLGCVVPPGMSHVRPMGASVHYAGTLPMSPTAMAHATTPDCQSSEYPNLHVVDGTTFPALPAKNLTLTLMANAVRVAERAFS